MYVFFIYRRLAAICKDGGIVSFIARHAAICKDGGTVSFLKDFKSRVYYHDKWGV